MKNVKDYEEQPSPILGTEEGEQPENVQKAKKQVSTYAADPYKREIVRQ